MNTQVSSRRAQRQWRALERARDSSGVHLSGHAQQRAAEFGFHETEVLACVARPEQTYTCPARYGPARRMFQRGDCACVVDELNGEVVTVLLRIADSWKHGVDDRRASGVRGRPIGRDTGGSRRPAVFPSTGAQDG